MITFMEAKEKSSTTTPPITTRNYINSESSERERSVDPQLWHACAGGMVQMPAVNSRVFYFPQGHAEHASSAVDFAGAALPPAVLCRVSAVRFLADHASDEVFARLTLSPSKDPDTEDVFDKLNSGSGEGFDSSGSEGGEKPASFAKTLTQSDANNGGGFSVPRYCAETIFPRLDYSADPPVQTILAKDVHGETWKFRHIYRGTPRRHLLTTGWSTFVNHKKLVAGDSIVFLRSQGTGELCVGIRRAKRGVVGPEWGGPAAHSKGRARPDEVAGAARAAAEGRVFEAGYYPRGGAPEFCVGEGLVRAAARARWWSGMRFKMAFETEDSSRISWFMGTVSGVRPADPIRWPDSPWRLLHVAWDEPDLLHNVTRVSPWLVEPVSIVAGVPTAALLRGLSPPRKKPRPMGPHLGTFPPPPAAAGMQGARHRYTLSLSDLILRSPHHYPSFLPSPPLLPAPPPEAASATAGRQQLVLFGRPILTEEQMVETATAHCKVFVESEDVGRTLDLSSLGSYDELYAKLADMFGIRDSEALARSLYRDSTGTAKQIGDEPFSDFTKTARRLTIPTDSGASDAQRNN